MYIAFQLFRFFQNDKSMKRSDVLMILENAPVTDNNKKKKKKNKIRIGIGIKESEGYNRSIKPHSIQ